LRRRTREFEKTMPSLRKLISVFEETRALLEAPDNDYSWSSWNDREAALAEIDEILYALRNGSLPSELTLEALFAPTGPIQEVSLSSGWGKVFIELSERFDAALASDDERGDGNQLLVSPVACECFAAPPGRLVNVRELGLDSRFAEASVLACRVCGQHWLKYLYEVEAFKGSGRWYLGAITPEQATAVTPESAKAALEKLDWYYYGGSYYEGRSGKASGEIVLNP
jgi:hypothetical protein